jgi:tetratricopeptide (TPR) repeat protein
LPARAAAGRGPPGGRGGAIELEPQPDLAAKQAALAAKQADLAGADRDADPVRWAWLSLEYAQALQALGGAHLAQAWQAYRDALTIFRRDDHPAQWFDTSLMLAYLIVGSRPVDEPALREALAILDELSGAADAASREDSFATALSLRATALTLLAGHDQSLYEAACEAHRTAAAAARSVAPMMFADARLALGELVMSHDGSDDEVISALGEALTVYRPKESAREWFRCHWYLGQILAANAATCPDLLAACAHLEEAVRVKPPEAEPADYAQACRELAVLLPDPRCPPDEARFDRAMAWSEECLKYWPEEDLRYRMDHADALARGYLRRAEISHDNGDLIRTAALLDQAAQWARQSGAPVERLAGLATDAAEAHAMIRTDRRLNFDIAIEGLTGLLEEAGSQMPAASLAMVRQSLGTTYQERIGGDPAGNLELSIENLEAALSAWDRKADPDSWASVANNLANSYWRRIRGDYGENLEKAIAYAEASSLIRTREKNPMLWARTVHALGNLYFHRALGDLSANMEKSISLTLAALEVETKEAYPDRWAGAHRNLGSAYLRREQGDRRENLEKSVACFRDSLSVTATIEDLQTRGLSLYGLANAVAARGAETGEQSDLAEAVTAYEQAAAAFEELGSPDQQAMTYFNLAMTLSLLSGDNAASRARQALRQCLPAWDADRNPLRGPRVYAMLARFSDELGQTAEAYEWISRAIEASETLYAGATAEDSKTEMVAEAASFFLFAVDLAMRSGVSASEVLLLAERGRSRMLREAAVRLQPEWSIPPELLEREAELITERRRAWEGIPAADPGSGPDERGFTHVQALTGQLAGAWEQIRDYPGGDQYVAARNGAISWDQIRRWVDAQPAGFALLEYVALPDRVLAFVVRQNRPEPALVDIPIDGEALGRCARALYREMDGSAAGRVRRETWDRAALPLVRMVQPELAGARLLCIVPHVVLHHLPLHALGEAGATLLDQMAVYYSPSAGLAVQLSPGSRPPRTAGLRALVVGDSRSDLRYARLEAEQVGRVLGVQPLLGEQATCDAVLAQLHEADLAHFACHGYLRLDDAALSAIVLADGVLTAGQLQRSGLRCDVLVLSGCDTGFEPVQRTMEVGGLPSALIAAGARTAIGGLWPVSDQATEELFTRFFRELAIAGDAGPTGSDAEPTGEDEISRSVAGCLRVAELAVRDKRPERYYWAPFIAVGSW